MARNVINATATDSYTTEGAGIGGGEESMERYPPEKGSFVLDIGFGDCKCVAGAVERGCTAFGVDIAEASWHRAKERRIIGKGFVPIVGDVSHDRLPIPDNTIDRAYCLEAIEHFSNPFYAFAEVKRVLKHRGKLVIAYPMPEKNLGYDCGDHAHVYPGFLQKGSFERFMMQMFFRKLNRDEHGNSAWYLYENCKTDSRVIDTFKVVAGNVDEEKTYGWLKRGEYK